MGSVTPVMRHKEYLADALQKAFPQYNSDIVRDYAMATAFDDDEDDIAADEEALEEVRQRMAKLGS